MEIKKKLPRLALVHEWIGRAESGNPQPVELRVSMNGKQSISLIIPNRIKIYTECILGEKKCFFAEKV